MASIAAIESSRIVWRAPAWLLPLSLLLALTLAFPRDYAGGGDDWYYLEAARCAANHGICLPGTHWEARFPLVLPMGWVLALFGENLWSVGLIPLLYTVVGLALFVANVERRFGDAAARLAGVVLALTPIFPLNALQPLVDQPEFAWTMAALFAIQIAVERHDGRWAAVAGAALALAVETRMTGLTLMPLLGLGWLAVPANHRWLALPCAIAGLAVFGIEAAVYTTATGDALYGWKLSLHHARIPTGELPSWVDTSQSPVLNLDFIRNWRRSAGVELHWTLDPLLNLLADPICGLTLCGAFALAVTRFGTWRRNRWLCWIAVAALLHFILLPSAWRRRTRPCPADARHGAMRRRAHPPGCALWQRRARSDRLAAQPSPATRTTGAGVVVHRSPRLAQGSLAKYQRRPHRITRHPASASAAPARSQRVGCTRSTRIIQPSEARM